MAEIKPLCAKNLAVESKPLFVPPLNEVAKGKKKLQSNLSKLKLKHEFIYQNIVYKFIFLLVLQDGLSKNFVSAEVNAVNCPNLRDAPFNLASEGIYCKI